ncbi:MAG: hypothetical protein ABSG53_13925 [Thermoguttaceae bacterium]
MNEIPDSRSAVVPDQVARGIEFDFEVTTISLAVAFPTGIIAIVLIAAGLVKSYRDRKWSKSKESGHASEP